MNEHTTKGRDHALMQLALEHRRAPHTFAEIASRLVQIGVNSLSVERATAWRLQEGGHILECIAINDREFGVRPKAPPLRKDLFPAYFSALSKSRVLVVSAARHDPRYTELSSYLCERGITGLVGAPIILHSKLVGVLCAETSTEQREWNVDECAFWESAADLAALAMAGEEQSAVNRRLHESDRLYRSLADDHDDLIVRTTRDGMLCFANRAAQDWYGGPHLGLRLLDHVPIAERATIESYLRTLVPENPTVRYEHCAYRAGQQDIGNTRTLVWTVRAMYDANRSLTGYQAIGRDVTDERARDARLRYAQRLEALAAFSGGIAHDFNNLLTPIVVFSNLMVGDPGLDAETKESAQHIRNAAHRAQQLVRELLRFSRSEEHESPYPMDAARVLREAISLIRTSIPSTVVLMVDVDVNCGTLVAREQDVYRILANLCSNALHAMPTGGEVMVRAMLVRCIDGHGASMQVVVRDTGFGIPERIRSHIFEPFFTTRRAGEGTGLGLCVVHSIVTRLRGTIEVESAAGLGTTFTIRLPVCELSSARTVTAPSPANADSRHHSQPHPLRQ